MEDEPGIRGKMPCNIIIIHIILSSWSCSVSFLIHPASYEVNFAVAHSCATICGTTASMNVHIWDTNGWWSSFPVYQAGHAWRYQHRKQRRPLPWKVSSHEVSPSLSLDENARKGRWHRREANEDDSTPQALTVLILRGGTPAGALPCPTASDCLFRSGFTRQLLSYD